MIERMYTVQETAEILRKSPKTIRRYIANGLLSARRSGVRSVVVPESELNRFMKPVEITEEQRLFKLVDDKITKTYEDSRL